MADSGEHARRRGYRFGDFLLVPAARVLFRGGSKVVRFLADHEKAAGLARSGALALGAAIPQTAVAAGVVVGVTTAVVKAIRSSSAKPVQSAAATKPRAADGVAVVPDIESDTAVPKKNSSGTKEDALSTNCSAGAGAGAGSGAGATPVPLSTALARLPSVPRRRVDSVTVDDIWKSFFFVSVELCKAAVSAGIISTQHIEDESHTVTCKCEHAEDESQTVTCCESGHYLRTGIANLVLLEAVVRSQHGDGLEMANGAYINKDSVATGCPPSMQPFYNALHAIADKYATLAASSQISIEELEFLRQSALLSDTKTPSVRLAGNPKRVRRLRGLVDDIEQISEEVVRLQFFATNFSDVCRLAKSATCCQ